MRKPPEPPLTDRSSPAGHEQAEHELKCWPQFFGAISDGSKTFEIRENDRNFHVGDVLWLREYDPGCDNCEVTHPATVGYSGRDQRVRVTYVTDWKQQPGYVVLGLAVLPPVEPPQELLVRIAKALGLPPEAATLPTCDHVLVAHAKATHEALVVTQQALEDAQAEQTRALLQGTVKGFQAGERHALNGPAGGAPVGQAEPTESTGALIARAKAFADEAYWNRSNKQARDLIRDLLAHIEAAPVAPEPPQKEEDPNEIARQVVDGFMEDNWKLISKHQLTQLIRIALSKPKAALLQTDAGYREKVRPYLRHTGNCSSNWCRICGWLETAHPLESTTSAGVTCVDFTPKPCSCGLTSLIHGDR